MSKCVFKGVRKTKIALKDFILTSLSYPCLILSESITISVMVKRGAM